MLRHIFGAEGYTHSHFLLPLPPLIHFPNAYPPELPGCRVEDTSLGVNRVPPFSLISNGSSPCALLSNPLHVLASKNKKLDSQISQIGSVKKNQLFDFSITISINFIFPSRADCVGARQKHSTT